MRVRGRLRAGLVVLADWHARVPLRVRALLCPPASEPRLWRGSLPVYCPSVPRPPSLHLVTCVAEAGWRAVPPSCGRL